AAADANKTLEMSRRRMFPPTDTHVRPISGYELAELESAAEARHFLSDIGLARDDQLAVLHFLGYPGEFVFGGRLDSLNFGEDDIGFLQAAKGELFAKQFFPGNAGEPVALDHLAHSIGTDSAGNGFIHLHQN